MTAGRSIKTLSVLASAALVTTSMLAGTADAKKKKPKPPPPPPVCAPYTPGELGADAETTVATPAATADAPVEVQLATEPGVGVGGLAEQGITHVYQNVQADVEGAGTLFVRLEMDDISDYDLYVRDADGNELYRAAGFNPVPEVYNDTEGGGHTEHGAEQIDGIEVSDCDGFTIDVAAAGAAGGEVTLKFWFE